MEVFLEISQYFSLANITGTCMENVTYNSLSYKSSTEMQKLGIILTNSKYSFKNVYCNSQQYFYLENPNTVEAFVNKLQNKDKMNECN